MVSFAFSTASGGPGNIGFECALTSGDQKNTTALFKACQSPLQYVDLADGQYQFYVRAEGEEIADSRAFTKVRTGYCQGIVSRPYCDFAAHPRLPGCTTLKAFCLSKQSSLRVP